MLPCLEAAKLPADAIEVGLISDAWGVKGWFKVLTYSSSPEALFSSKRWFLMPPAKGGKNFVGVALLAIKEAKNHSDMVVASAHDVLDRTSAELLKGARIFVSRASFPTAEKDEYYWVDLIGLQVINREGIDLGKVQELISSGPQTVLVMSYEEQGQNKERMIPFVNVYIDQVDLLKKTIFVDWQSDF